MKQIVKIQVEFLDTETKEFELITIEQERIDKHMAFAVVLREECRPFVVETDPEMADDLISSLGMDHVHRVWAQGPTLDQLMRRFVEGRTKTYQEVRNDRSSTGANS